MRKVTGKKKEMENGDAEEVDNVESETEENGVDEDADPLANAGENGDDEPAEDQENENGEEDAPEPENDDDEEEEEDKPLKPSKKAGKKKKEKKAAKKAAKKKKNKKRVSLNVPADKVDPEDESDEDAEYEVQNIVAHRYVGNRLEYKIRWKGYSAKDDTWESKSSLSCPDIIKKYEASHDTKPKGSKKAATPKRKGGKVTTPAKKKARHESEEENDDSDDDGKEYEVARLIDVRTKKGKREFLVHWKGWSSRFDNWEPEENLNCDDLIKQFDKKLKNVKSSTQKELRVAPKSTKRLPIAKPKGARTSKRGGGKTRVTYYDDE